MKTLLYFWIFLMSFMAYSQSEANKSISLTEPEQDDVYLAAETININAKIEGDAVIAGGTLTFRDTITQDLIAAGGEINISGFIKDDIRIAGGELAIDAEIEDDVIVFGGELFITKDAVIHGNLICFSGDVILNGTVKGFIKVYAGDLVINGTVMNGAEIYAGDLSLNGEISGKTKIVAEDIVISDNAKFYGDVEYWSESGAVDFKNSLDGEKAIFNEDLARKNKDFPWEFFGVAAIGLWLFYLASAFLIILICNALFKKFFSKTITLLDKNILKSFGYGLIYIFGLPILILLTFIILIGIPIGLFLAPIYIFSLFIGHLVFALLMAHYINKRRNNDWGFWPICFLALGIAVALRFITLIPFLGTVASIVLIAIAYGLIGIKLLKKDSKVLV